MPPPFLGRMKRAMSLSMLNTDGSRVPENQVRGPLDQGWDRPRGQGDGQAGIGMDTQT